MVARIWFHIALRLFSTIGFGAHWFITFGFPLAKPTNKCEISAHVYAHFRRLAIRGSKTMQHAFFTSRRTMIAIVRRRRVVLLIYYWPDFRACQHNGLVTSRELSPLPGYVKLIVTFWRSHGLTSPTVGWHNFRRHICRPLFRRKEACNRHATPRAPLKVPGKCPELCTAISFSPLFPPTARNQPRKNVRLGFSFFLFHFPLAMLLQIVAYFAAHVLP